MRDKKILFTGTHPERFKNIGEVIHQPMINVMPLDDYSLLDYYIKDLDRYDWIIFTSRYAVKYFYERLSCLKRQNVHAKICAIGRGTADALHTCKLTVDCIPGEESSQGIIEIFKKIDIRDKNILIPRSNLAYDLLPVSLKAMGGCVQTVTVYKNIKPAYSKLIDLSTVDEVFFTSPSTFKNFMEFYKHIPSNVRIKCIGKITCSAVRAKGLKPDIWSYNA